MRCRPEGTVREGVHPAQGETPSHVGRGLRWTGDGRLCDADGFVAEVAAIVTGRDGLRPETNQAVSTAACRRARPVELRGSRSDAKTAGLKLQAAVRARAADKGKGPTERAAEPPVAQVARAVRQGPQRSTRPCKKVKADKGLGAARLQGGGGPRAPSNGSLRAVETTCSSARRCQAKTSSHVGRGFVDPIAARAPSLPRCPSSLAPRRLPCPTMTPLTCCSC